MGTHIEAGFRRFATFELDLRTGELRKHGSRLRLQQQPFLILAMLLEKPGELITHEQFQQKLWPADTFVDFDHGLKEAVRKLRKALDDSATTPRFIETLDRRGYRFIYPVEVALDSSPRQVPYCAPDFHQVPESDQVSEPHKLPSPRRAIPRFFFLLLQVVWLAIYVAALVRLLRIEDILSSWFGSAGNELVILLLVTAVLGVALRLFLLNAVAFDYQGIGRLFRRVFWPIFLLDVFWSLSPFLLAHKFGVGLAFACFATLVWLPFAQRTLLRMAYRWNQ